MEWDFIILTIGEIKMYYFLTDYHIDLFKNVIEA